MPILVLACVVEEGVEYHGSALSGTSPSNVIDWRECADDCGRDKMCSHWTFKSGQFDRGLCYLKTSNSGRNRTTTHQHPVFSGQQACGRLINYNNELRYVNIYVLYRTSKNNADFLAPPTSNGNNSETVRSIPSYCIFFTRPVVSNKEFEGILLNQFI